MCIDPPQQFGATKRGALCRYQHGVPLPWLVGEYCWASKRVLPNVKLGCLFPLLGISTEARFPLVRVTREVCVGAVFERKRRVTVPRNWPILCLPVFSTELVHAL